MMMKKLISLFCVLALVIGIAAVGAVSTSAAVDSAKTMIDVKKGQTVTYRLKLSDVESKVIGSDFSIYYDPAVLTVDSVLDFNDHDQDEWAGNWIANPNLSGEVLCNFSIISGVKFNEQRSFITVNFTANADATTDITYFVRFLYDYKIFIEDLQKSKPQITNFKFTCDVAVDGETILEDAQPELNVDEPQEHGAFINTVTGDSSDADPETPGAVVDKDKAVAARDAYDSVDYNADEEKTILYGDSDGSGDADNGNSGGNQSGGSNQNGGSGNASSSVQNNNKNADSDVTAAPPATTAEGYYITATDSDGNVTATSDEAPVVKTTGTDNKGGSSPVIWIVIALVVLAGGGAGVYFYMKKKKQPSDTPVSEASAEKEPAADEKDSVPEEKEPAAEEKDPAPEEMDSAAEVKE